VANTRLDGGFTSRALIGLDGLIGLHRMHDLAVVACKLRKKAGLVGSLVIGHVGMVERIRTFPFWRGPPGEYALGGARTGLQSAAPPVRCNLPATRGTG
jgi:hypothetical protein